MTHLNKIKSLFKKFSDSPSKLVHIVDTLSGKVTQTVNGNNVSIQTGGRVIIDGVDYTSNQKHVTVVIMDGVEIDELNATEVFVQGSVISEKLSATSVRSEGDIKVSDKISATSITAGGDVVAGKISATKVKAGRDVIQKGSVEW